jgi:HD superfamily phosphohydrolase
MNKLKMINDPVYGFVKIPFPIVYDIIQHSYFQRLRRIKQLGLTDLVYPGAVHTRFQHVLGATHLIGNAIQELRIKGVGISEAEVQGVTLAILLHDIGHGPFSHTLEKSFVKNISHEEISLLYMKKLNKIFEGQLDLCIEIFTDRYPKKFLHQLVSSQLDMDRLDYLRRDSFFTGVVEGNVGSERIIQMLNVHKDRLVVQQKGIYSVEKFLIARRLMYWQVYLHKTVVSGEQMLIKILKRAKKLASNGEKLFASRALHFFLYHDIENVKDFCKKRKSGKTGLDYFSQLDDTDIILAIKEWTKHSDRILSTLCSMLIDRKLLKTEIFSFSERKKAIKKIKKVRKRVQKKYDLNKKEVKYFAFGGKIYNNAYAKENDNKINIISKDLKIKDIAEASDISNVKALSKTVTKYFICSL